MEYLSSSPSRTYVVPVYIPGTNYHQLQFRKFTLPNSLENNCATATHYFYNGLERMSCGKEAYPIEMHNDIVGY